MIEKIRNSAYICVTIVLVLVNNKLCRYTESLLITVVRTHDYETLITMA